VIAGRRTEGRPLVVIARNDAQRRRDLRQQLPCGLIFRRIAFVDDIAGQNDEVGRRNESVDVANGGRQHGVRIDRVL